MLERIVWNILKNFLLHFVLFLSSLDSLQDPLPVLKYVTLEMIVDWYQKLLSFKAYWQSTLRFHHGCLFILDWKKHGCWRIQSLIRLNVIFMRFLLWFRILFEWGIQSVFKDQKSWIEGFGCFLILASCFGAFNEFP